MKIIQLKKTTFSLAFFALMTCFSQNAKAAQIFDWQFYSWGGAALVGSGQLVAGPHPDSQYQTINLGGQNIPFFQITGMSGNFMGRTITGVTSDRLNLLDPRSVENAPGVVGMYIPNTWNVADLGITTTSNSSYLVMDSPYGRNNIVYEVQTVGSNSAALEGGYMLVTPSAVPEPSALSLLAIGLGGLALVQRRRA
jgi:hypothetical protein